MKYPAIFIDNSVPEGWGVKYPTLIVDSVKTLREFSSSYFSAGKSVRYGLDLRSISVNQMSPLLKLMESSEIELILRFREPVPEVILSRAREIHKTSKYEIKSAVELLIEGESVIDTKIRSLKGGYSVK